MHGSGVLVYLSATWLSELYQQVLACNLLEKCGYNPHYTENSALINVLTGERILLSRRQCSDIIEESLISRRGWDSRESEGRAAFVRLHKIGESSVVSERANTGGGSRGQVVEESVDVLLGKHDDSFDHRIEPPQGAEQQGNSQQRRW